jgi:hypothetical protein
VRAPEMGARELVAGERLAARQHLRRELKEKEAKSA